MRIKNDYKAIRWEKIKSLVSEAGQIAVQDLSKQLDVSDVTIRKDLNSLEQQGFLHRTHGGAVILKQSASASPDIHKQEAPDVCSFFPYDAVKEKLGLKASEFVDSNEWIFLGEGSTCYFIAKALSLKKNINIMTNSICNAIVFRDNPSINVIVAGGNFFHNRLVLGGEICANFINNRNISKAFMGVEGIEYNNGFTLTNPYENVVFEAVKNASKELFIVADHSKFGKIGFESIGDLCSANAIITSEPIPPLYSDFFSNHNIPVYYSLK